MQFELVSACMLGGMAGIVSLAAMLISAIWRGRWPRPRPTAAAFLVVVLTTGVLASNGGTGEQVLVAGAVVDEPTCYATSKLLRPQLSAIAPTHVSGRATPELGCGVWALIEDPRTGTRWLQGPATQSGDRWEMALVLGTTEASAASLQYRLAVLQVSPDIHSAWLAAALQHGPLSFGSAPVVDAWLASPTIVLALPAEASS